MKKKIFVFIALAALVALFAPTGPVLAQSYTVTGDLSAAGFTSLAGSQSYTGTLSGLFNASASGAAYVNNGTPYNDMYGNQDYIVATSSSGATATFSVGEISVGNQGSTINITGNSTTGYTISGNGQTLSNLTNINVVHTTAPPGTYPGGYSNSFTIQGAFTPTGVTSFSSTNFPGTYTTVTVAASSGNSNNYTGVSLLSLLQQAGVNTANLNQYVIATGSDGGETLLSMDEIVQNSTGSSTDIVATKENGSALSGTRGYARLVLPTDTGTSRSVFTLASLDVEPVPVPASFLLFGPGLAGLAAIRKRLKN